MSCGGQDRHGKFEDSWPIQPQGTDKKYTIEVQPGVTLSMIHATTKLSLESHLQILIIDTTSQNYNPVLQICL